MATSVQNTSRNVEALKDAGLIGKTDDGRGFLWAQRIIAQIKATALDYGRMAHELWDMSVEARKFAHKTLTQFRTEAAANAKQNGNVAGYDAKKWGRIARSATVQASNMQSIIKAMNGTEAVPALTKKDFAKLCGIDVADVENVGFTLMHQVCRDYNGAKAAAGRKPDAMPLRLSKWLKAQAEKATETEDADGQRFIAKVTKVLVANHIELPEPKKEEKATAPATEAKVAAKRAPRKVKAVQAAAKQAGNMEKGTGETEQPSTHH